MAKPDTNKYIDYIFQMVQEDAHVPNVNGVARLKFCACRDEAMTPFVDSLTGMIVRVAGGPFALELTPGKRAGLRRMTLLETLIAECSQEDQAGYLHLFCGRMFIAGHKTESQQQQLINHLHSRVARYNKAHHGHYELSTPVTDGSARSFMRT